MDCIRDPSRSPFFNGILFRHPVFSQTPLLPSKLLVCLLSAICSCSAIQMWALKIATCSEFKSCSRTCYRESKCGTSQYTVTNELDCSQNNPWLSAVVKGAIDPCTHPFCLVHTLLISVNLLKETCFVLVRDLIYWQTPYQIRWHSNGKLKVMSPPNSAYVSAIGNNLWLPLKLQSENCQQPYVVSWCLNRLLLYLVGRSLKGTK